MISYATSSSTGSVKIVQDKFPSELWLKEVAIPEIWGKQYQSILTRPNQKSIVITGFYEFKDAQDFYDFIDGYDMDEKINDLLL